MFRLRFPEEFAILKCFDDDSPVGSTTIPRRACEIQRLRLRFPGEFARLKCFEYDSPKNLLGCVCVCVCVFDIGGDGGGKLTTSLETFEKLGIKYEEKSPPV